MEQVTTGIGTTPSQRRKRKLVRKRLTWGVILVLIVAVAAFGIEKKLSGGQNVLSDLQTAKAFRTTIVETVSAAGSVTSQTGTQVNIGSQITGTIRRLYADVGSHVTAGQIIAELYLPDLNAQVAQAEASLQQSVVKYQQTASGLGMQHSQLADAVTASLNALKAAEGSRSSALDAAAQAPLQTSSDINKAKSALDTAQAQNVQAQKSYDLDIATAQAAIDQAAATYKNDSTNLNREEQLFHQGFVGASDVDTAQAASDVASAQLISAQKNLSLIRARDDAGLITAQKAVQQAQATLTSAKAETFTNSMRAADVKSADAAVHQANAQLNSAIAGMHQDVLNKQNVEQARYAVIQAEQQVKYEQAQLDKTFIRTPITGTVLQLAEQQGETLAAGLSAPTLIVVADLNKLQIDAFVDETDIGKVKLGQSVTTTVDAYPNQTFTGKITKIAAGATTQNNVVTYDVTVAIKDPKHELLPSMTASVTIAVGEHPNVIAVPNEALKPGKTSGYILYVQKSPNTDPVMVVVDAGATDGTYTEIKSGVSDGETVVLAGWPPPNTQSGPMQMTPFGMRPGRPASTPAKPGGH